MKKYNMFTKHYKTLFVFLIILFSSAHILLAEEKHFTILHTTDEHSHLLPAPLTDYHPEKDNPALGGFARLATIIQEIRNEKSKEDEPVLLLSSGDVMGGTPFAWLILNNYSPELEIMKHLQYDAMTIGNHEFDYGPEVLATYFKRAGFDQTGKDFAIISSNLDIPTGNMLNEINLEENRVYTLSNGLKIGIFGLLGEAAYQLAPYAEPVQIFYSVDAAKKQVEKLKAQNVDVIIAITHSGIEEDRTLARKVNGIDLILGGHDHIKTEEPEYINDTYVFHSSYYLQKLGMLEFGFDTQNKHLRLLNKANNTPFLIPLDNSIPEDSVVREMVNFYKNELNKFVAQMTDSLFYDVQKPVIKSDFSLERTPPFVETPMGNFLTDAMRLMTEELTGEKVHFAFQGNGVIRANLNPGTTAWSENQISFFDMVTVSGLGSGPDMMPGYPLISVYLTEREIINVLEVTAMLSQIYGDIFFLQFSGLKYTYDPGKAFWLKVPVLDLPIPANRAVISAKKYTGEGVQQQDGEYKRLKKSNEEGLYKIVTDYYIASFLPLVGELLPDLTIILKDKNGNEITVDEAIVMYEGRELKVWEVLVRYAAQINEEGGSIPEYYASTSSRITVEKGTPLWVWSVMVIALVLFVLVMILHQLVLWLKRRKAA